MTSEWTVTLSARTDCRQNGQGCCRNGHGRSPDFKRKKCTLVYKALSSCVSQLCTDGVSKTIQSSYLTYSSHFWYFTHSFDHLPQSYVSVFMATLYIKHCLETLEQKIKKKKRATFLSL